MEFVFNCRLNFWNNYFSDICRLFSFLCQKYCVASYFSKYAVLSNNLSTPFEFWQFMQICLSLQIIVKICQWGAKFPFSLCSKKFYAPSKKCGFVTGNLFVEILGITCRKNSREFSESFCCYAIKWGGPRALKSPLLHGRIYQEERVWLYGAIWASSQPFIKVYSDFVL